MEMRSALNQARGLGSSKEGVGHWWVQRLTGLALIPLTLWFVFSAINLTGADLAEFSAWAGRHGNPVLLILLIVVMYHHAQAGVQVVIEDYVHSETAKVTCIILTKFAAVLFGGASVFAVLRLTFGG
jgi:succinate dehydrogenase / fumarate reductase membrane anchor subunit